MSFLRNKKDADQVEQFLIYPHRTVPITDDVHIVPSLDSFNHPASQYCICSPNLVDIDPITFNRIWEHKNTNSKANKH